MLEQECVQLLAREPGLQLILQALCFRPWLVPNLWRRFDTQ